MKFPQRNNTTFLSVFVEEICIYKIDHDGPHLVHYNKMHVHYDVFIDRAWTLQDLYMYMSMHQKAKIKLNGYSYLSNYSVITIKNGFARD